MTEGTGVMQDFGTGVPGLGSHESHPRLDVLAPRRDDALYLAVSHSRRRGRNFDDAVADGRAVVLYPEAGPTSEGRRRLPGGGVAERSVVLRDRCRSCGPRALALSFHACSACWQAAPERRISTTRTFLPGITGERFR